MLRFLPLFSLASAAHLYATHYSGSLSTLTLDRAANGSYALSIAASEVTCGGMPSWLTLDATTRTLYCSDETGDASTTGSLSTYTVGRDGALTQTAKVVDVGGPVNSIVYEGVRGEKYLAIAHYTGSAVTTFSLPIQPSSKPHQVLRYTLPHPGPRPEQDSPHPHQVILDPTGAFILIPDLGADQVRVYAIDKHTGQLDACPSLEFTPGSGPRHGVFWSSADAVQRGSRSRRPGHAAETFLYTVSELSRHFDAFAVSYPAAGCLAFHRTQDFIPYPGGETPQGASLAEIRLAGHNLYASVRSDHAFKPNDSLVTLTRAHNGTVALRELTSAYGTVPRTMVINKAGTLVAVGDQASANVAIIARNPKSGKLGDLVASVQVGEPGKPGTSTGLSSVIWAE
ncbi:lactonase family protein [Aspergillus clavatus NRRL 1]|uniref:6-phosphogluconolactonase n=1 Tax=Aspergillus clavatus (strain ATCC 1007 / CBS 513.65 / DSM 816 / NCTC 3887 / NRRL 1 / QM 1276 / 107) TaxID=344612 RepID=A1CEE8_ASPCL|nr:uncharacterized protein ACLA_089390 [Aspergillus clavatus NRRL 1]EAW11247.1 conserved hypothetical protein [Aspergillus clavatus NRRL 1]